MKYLKNIFYSSIRVISRKNILDDSIATSHCTGGVWVMMFEKCLANAYGSYAILHRGFVNFCLTDTIKFAKKIFKM